MEGSNSSSARKGKGVAEPEAEVHPMGTIGQLLRIGGATGRAVLIVVCGSANESVARVDSGDFSMVLVRRSGTTPLSLLSCVVGEHQWPLAQDSPVLRVGPRRFSFAFPGFFYGLALPEGCFDDDVRKLEFILVNFCSYENHATERDYDFCSRRTDTDFWASSYTKIKKLSFAPGPSAVPRGTSGIPPVPGDWTREETTLKWQRALRTSAATKVVAKVLLGDTIDPNLHVEVAGLGAAATSSASVQRGPYIFASLRAISDVVDAVEASRGVGAGSWSMAPGHWVPSLPNGAMHWHFNVAGLTLVLRAVAAVAAQTSADVVRAGGGTGGEGSSSSLGGQASGASMVANQTPMSGPPWNC